MSRQQESPTGLPSNNLPWEHLSSSLLTIIRHCLAIISSSPPVVVRQFRRLLDAEDFRMTLLRMSLRDIVNELLTVVM